MQVDYYGAPTPLRQIANLSAPEASMLVVQPYDKSSIPNIEKAIMSSDLGLTPGNDGNLIRINVPQLTAVRTPKPSYVCKAMLAAQTNRLTGPCLLQLRRLSCHVSVIWSSMGLMPDTRAQPLHHNAQPTILSAAA